MPDAPLPLDDLTRQIAEHESLLERLRLDYEARQARLAELSRRREELQDQLRQVEADIQAVTAGASPAAAPPPAEIATAAVPIAPPPAKPASRRTLADALVELVAAAGRPMTAKQLAEELTRRKFPTTSGNLTNVVQVRLKDLVRKGVFRRPAGLPGVIPGKAAGGPKAQAPPAEGTGRAAAAPKAPQAKASAPGAGTGRTPLRVVLTDLLQKSRRPLAARELAAQALAAGYRTKIQDFTDVVWTALGQMENVENVKGLGWRLTRR
jgi:hypothetical protein